MSQTKCHVFFDLFFFGGEGSGVFVGLFTFLVFCSTLRSLFFVVSKQFAWGKQGSNRMTIFGDVAKKMKKFLLFSI